MAAIVDSLPNDFSWVRYQGTNTVIGKKLSRTVFYWMFQNKFLRVYDNDTTLHSEKFKMKRNGNSILSENICDLLIV